MRSHEDRWYAVAAGLAGCLLVMSCVACRPSAERSTGEEVDGRGERPGELAAVAARRPDLLPPAPLGVNVNAEVAGYVGPAACAACHGERVAEFKETGHWRAFRIPHPDEMPPGLERERAEFVTRFPGIRFQMAREGDAYVQTAIHETRGGEQRTTSQVDFILGAATADDVYLTWRDDGQMFELPMAWLWTSDQWAAAFFDPHAGGDFTRPTTPRCLECHNTWFNHVPGTLNQYHRDDFIIGVTCERCHGPGREHVEFHQAHPGETAAKAIVHPAKLSRQRNIEVCTQCHSNALKHRGPAFRYRPGEPLDDYYRTLSVTNSEDDHVAAQIRYLQESKCFQATELTCTTCHDPHHVKKVDYSAIRSCLGCHQREHCGERSGLPAAVQDDCIGCHMPLYTKINVNFQTADDNHVPPIRRYDHRIAVHPKATREVLLHWYRSQSDDASRARAADLETQLVDQWLSEADQFQQAHRYLAAIAALREARRLSDRPDIEPKLKAVVAIRTQLDDALADAIHLMTQERREEAIHGFQQVLQLKPDLADAHGRLGTLYAMADDRQRGIEHWEAESKHNPDSPYGLGMLGWVAYLDGRPEALEYFRRADEVEPYNGKIHHQIALALLQQNRLAEGVAALQKALTIEPQRIDSCQVLTRALWQMGREEEALPFAVRAVHLTGRQDLPLLLLLAQSYANANRLGEALEVAEEALLLARRQQSPLVPDVLELIELLRAAR